MARWQDYVLRDTRANQPSGPLVTTGTLYCVTDESDIVERWSGTAWEAYSPTATGTGDVVGPAGAINNDIAVFNGVTGKLIKDGGSTITQVLATALANAVAAIIPIDLVYDVTGDLHFSNFQQASAASRLLGRGSAAGAGDFQEITLGSNLSMTGTVLSASGGGSGAMTFVGSAVIAGAAASVLTISGLDLATDQMYLITWSLKNATASQTIISLYYSADTTAGNYFRQNWTFSNTTGSGSSANDGAFIIMAASGVNVGNARIQPDANGRPRAQQMGFRENVSDMTLFIANHVRNNTGNVTSITLSSSVGSALDIGSIIKVFKITS